MSLSWPVPVNSLPNPLNKPVTGRTLWSSSPVYMLVPNSHLCCFQSWGQSYFQRHPSLHLHLESMLVSEQSQKAVSFIVSDLFLTGSFNKKKNAYIPQNLNEAFKFRFQPYLMQRKKSKLSNYQKWQQSQRSWEWCKKWPLGCLSG